MRIARRLHEPGLLEDAVEEVGERVLKKLVGDATEPLAAARAKEAKDVLAAANPTLRFFGTGDGNVFGPSVDGWVIPDLPAHLFEQGRFARVPLITGTNGNEGTIFLLQAPPITPELHEAGTRKLFGNAAEKLLAWYTTDRYGDLTRVRGAMFGDLLFVAPTRAQVRAMSDHDAPCYLYRFTRIAGGRPQRLGAFHGSEIAYVFGHLERGLLSQFDATDQKLSATMMDYWVQFARTGDPNREGLPKWPRFVEEDDPYLELGDDVKASHGLQAEECDLWDRAFEDWKKRASGS
jgi:para-nitrobenzyl esterase